MKTSKDVLQAWIDRVNRGDVEQILALYSSSATLIPTFSARTLSKRDDLRKYFTSLGERPKLGVSLHDRTLHEQPVAGTVNVLSGIYTFRFELDGELLTFEARFTFVVDPAQAAPILHQHSSQIPRTLN